MIAAPPSASVVYMIDGDETSRLAMYRLLRSIGIRSEALASLHAFTMAGAAKTPSCLLLDPGCDQRALEFPLEMTQRGLLMPVIFVTAQADVRLCASVMKAGAFDFFPKPFPEAELLHSIRQALSRDRSRIQEAACAAARQAAYETLTRREREVMARVVSGMLNKQIAMDMQLSEITVKGHRAMAMKKMGATSLADLVRKADALRLDAARER